MLSIPGRTTGWTLRFPHLACLYQAVWVSTAGKFLFYHCLLSFYNQIVTCMDQTKLYFGNFVYMKWAFMETMGRKFFCKKRPLPFLLVAASPTFTNSYLNKVSPFHSSAFGIHLHRTSPHHSENWKLKWNNLVYVLVFLYQPHIYLVNQKNWWSKIFVHIRT